MRYYSLIYRQFVTQDSTDNKACFPPASRIRMHSWDQGRGAVYPSIHFFTRQAARERLAAMRALTETARERHLALAEEYRQRAEAMRAA